MSGSAGLSDLLRVPSERRRILAMGGGGFTSGEVSPALDRLVLELTDRPVPRVCFLPTASGDQREQILRFHERFGAWSCEPTAVSLFHLGRDRIDPRDHLLAQDVIYVGGGSMRNMLAIWREHGIDRIMRQAWEAGTVLAGLSAGAMCWFEGGVSLSGGRPEAVAGLNLVPGSLSVHRRSEPIRLPFYRSAVASGALPDGYALDDGVALVYAGRELIATVGSRPGAGGERVVRSGTASRSFPVQVSLLPEAAPPDAPGPGTRPASPREEAAIQELRSLRQHRTAPL